jgi:enoyl-CoA hydratase/carnithine racemase
MPFDVADRDGVLTLTLDTPGSPVNVFNHATAHQLRAILRDVTPATTRAIVFRSAKPGSFINGVGLLLAHATRTYDDVVRAAAPPWRAYLAVKEAPVPTIAVVDGNCFGCGVEFALSCDYRIATDACDTRFYMTELNDYLFLPLFGATWNLPEAVGIADAIDLLLWGERWDADTAYQHGLVDEVVPHEDVGAGADRLVARVLAGTQPSRRRGRVVWTAAEDAAVEHARRRIATLPAEYRGVYADALHLLADGARQGRTYAEHQRAELERSAASALSPLGKAAYAFFYLRQMASERAGGRGRGAPPEVTLAVDVDDSLGRDLRTRRLRGVRFPAAGPTDFHLVAADAVSRNGRGTAVAVESRLAAVPAADVTVYAPLHHAGGRLLEVAARSAGAGEDELVRLARTLQRFGFEVVRTMPTEHFVTRALLHAFLAPIVRAVALGEDVARVNGTLREAGFVRLPGDLVADLGVDATADALPAEIRSAVVALERVRDAGRPGDRRVLDALCVSLLDAVLAARARRDVRDPTVADLIAREALDFPRHLTSLCTWLQPARVAAAVAADVSALVPGAAIGAAEAFVAGGRGLYR